MCQKNLFLQCRSLGGHFVANQAKNSAKDLLDEIIFFYKFEGEHFNPIFVRRNLFFADFQKFQLRKKLGSRIHKSPKYIGSAIAIPQSGTFAESPQI
jgi:hypothetical protein